MAEILKQYGDWLYRKGNHAAAMDQYLKTVPHLEPSYVIRKVVTGRMYYLFFYIRGENLATKMTEQKGPLRNMA